MNKKLNIEARLCGPGHQLCGGRARCGGGERETQLPQMSVMNPVNRVFGDRCALRLGHHSERGSGVS